MSSSQAPVDGPVWKDLAAALSLANLSLLKIWSGLLTYSRADTYVMKLPPSSAEYAAGVANVLALGALVFALLRLGRRLGGRARAAARCGFLLLALLPANALRAVLSDRLPYLKSDLILLVGARGVALLAVAAAAAVAFLVYRWNRPLAHALAALLVIASPFVPLTCAQAIWKAAHYDESRFLNGPPAPPLSQPARSSPRVLWVIFDEWDQRLTFVDRLPGLALPEIDRFRAEALYASQAVSPGPETTYSMPSMTTGRVVKQFRQEGPGELLVRYDGSSGFVSWGQQPNVFQKARDEGFRTAVLGWYQPFCRVMSRSLDACEWWVMPAQHNSMGRSFFEAMPDQVRTLFETSLFSPFGQSLSTIHQARTYRIMLREAEKLAAGSGYGLVLVHLPIPHAPHAYDRKRGTLTLANAPLRGYYDSLALTDRTVGELRRTMERAGTWDASTVLLSSDHPYRAAGALDGKTDPRVPFLLKLAGHREPVVVDAPFNTVLTHDLLLGILRGELATPAQVAAWLAAPGS